MKGRQNEEREGRDLLAYLSRYAARQDHSCSRTDRWRTRRWSFPRVAAEAGRVATALEGVGVMPGDRVALYLNDGPLWHAAFFGALRAGAVAVPLDAGLEPARLRELVVGLELVGWCTESEVPELGLDLPRVELEWLEGVVAPTSAAKRLAGSSDTSESESASPWPADDPERVAQIVLTSGTTGAPKAVPVTHQNMRAVLDALDLGIDRYRRWIRLAPPLRVAVSLPLSHLYGQVMGVFVPAMLPADAIFLPAMPGAELARTLRDGKAWVLATVPRTLALLADHLRSEGEEAWGAAGFAERLETARALPWWRRRLALDRLHRVLGRRLIGVVSGGAGLDPELESFWRAMGYVVIQGYGLTETAPLVTLTHPFDFVPGSLGRPLPGVDVRLALDGEILVRGPNVAVARLGGPAVDAEGWLHTGDLGRWQEGRLIYLGRKGERIVTPAGVNIDPEPIVARLQTREELVDAVVMERPWGPRGVVSAVLLGRPGADPGAAVAAVNRDLPDAARIRDWHVWPEPDFPRTGTGKPRRREIREWLLASAPASDAAVRQGAVTPLDRPSDPTAVLLALAAEVAGLPPEKLRPDDRIGDLLTSLDRVELATRLEALYGATLDFGGFAGESTMREVAEQAFATELATAERPSGPLPPEPDTDRVPSQHLEPAGGGTVGAGSAVARSPHATLDDRSPAFVRRSRREIPELQWRHWLPTRAARHLVREGAVQTFWRPAIETRVCGLDRLGSLEPPFLLAANHLSILDPLAILFALPFRLRRRTAPSAMWEHFARGGRLWQYWLAVLGLDLVPLVQVGDWRPSLRVAGRLADRGWGTLVFPEGARSDDGELLPFRLGTAIMARELHLPIVPCGLMGTLTVMPKGSRWFSNCWIGRAPVGVAFGHPLPAPRPDDDPYKVLEELRNRVEPLRQEALAAAGRP